MDVNNNLIKILIFIGFLLITIFLYFQAGEMGWLDVISNKENLLILLKDLGPVGPASIIILIALAIIITPIPSAPVALVSGALYGHIFGTIYVVTGALLGALLAFMISKKLGYDFVRKNFHHRMPSLIVDSQNTLMVIVLVSRFMPFISFDVISYAAGLTKLTYLRFIVATLIGIIPMSFLLAHLGSEIQQGEEYGIGIALLLLGLITMLPVLFNKFKNYFKR